MFYLTYRNDFISVKSLSECFDLELNEAQAMLKAGERFHEENIELYNITGINYFAEYVERHNLESYKRFI